VFDEGGLDLAKHKAELILDLATEDGCLYTVETVHNVSNMLVVFA
jgi:hypothetical protein